MTATSHALAGAVIGLSISQPVVALPLALASHFLLDMVPHFGLQFTKHQNRRKIFHQYLVVDATLLALIIGFLIFSGAGWLVLACLFLAGCPDFVQAYYYSFNKEFKAKLKPKNRFMEFHKKIQRSETPKGLLVEIPLAIVLFYAITRLL